MNSAYGFSPAIAKRFAPPAKVGCLGGRFLELSRDEIVAELVGEEGDLDNAELNCRDILRARSRDLYNRLCDAISDARQGPHDRDVIGRVDDLVDSARVNADDMQHVDKVAADWEWGRSFRGSLESVLAFGLSPDRHLDAKVKAWFAERGVNY